MNMKKSILLLAPVCATVLLGSCGKGPDRVVSDKGYVRELTDIVFKTTAGKKNQAVLNNYIKTFKEIEPNVEVKLDIVSGSYADIAANTISGFNTGDYGDIVMVYPDAVADFIDYGRAFNLDPYINNAEYGLTEADKADLVPTFFDEGRHYTLEGTYSVPMSKSTEVVYYDKDRVEGLQLEGVNGGMPIDETYLQNLTWEEFFGNLCPKILAYTETPEGANLIDKTGTNYAVMGYDSDDNLFITLAAQYGYDYTNIVNGKGEAQFNNQNMKDLMYKFNDYAKKHYIFTAGSQGGTRSNDFFKLNQILFSVGSTAGSSYQHHDANIGVFKIPHAEGKAPKVILQGPSVSILKHKNKDNKWDKNRMLASWLFYKHMISEQNAFDWSVAANYMPIRQSAYESQDYKELYDPSTKPNNSLEQLDARIATYVGNLTSYYFTSPAFKGSNTCRQVVGGIVTEALKETNGQAEIDKAFETALAEAKKAIGL